MNTTLNTIEQANLKAALNYYGAMQAKNFGGMLKEIHIRSKFADNNQVMLAYDMIVPDPIGKFRAAALMDFKNNKITRIELFYDARAFEVKKDDIFSGSAS